MSTVDDAVSELADRLLVTATQLMVAQVRSEGRSVLVRTRLYDECAHAAYNLMLSCGHLATQIMDKALEPQA